MAAKAGTVPPVAVEGWESVAPAEAYPYYSGWTGRHYGGDVFLPTSPDSRWRVGAERAKVAMRTKEVVVVYAALVGMSAREMKE